ncbi:hypothetical protein Tco_0081313, partial [Tanacetum coccineum]
NSSCRNLSHEWKSDMYPRKIERPLGDDSFYGVKGQYECTTLE